MLQPAQCLSVCIVCRAYADAFLDAVADGKDLDEVNLYVRKVYLLSFVFVNEADYYRYAEILISYTFVKDLWNIA